MAKSMLGHIFPGLGFFLIGLWHLFNHIKLHHQNPKSFTIHPWFPTKKVRYLELFLIIIGSCRYTYTEIFRHHHLDPDGTIPTSYLISLEHTSITIFYIVSAGFAIVLDFVGARAKYSLTQLLAAVALGQQLIMFRLHSTNHSGLEGQYHLFLQILTIIALSSTLMAIGFRKSFILGFCQSLSLLFVGVWMIAIGVMLGTPGFLPKGCSLVSGKGHQEVNCRDEESLHRAKALINIEFSWYVIGIMIFSMWFYLFLGNVVKVKYLPLGKNEKKGEKNHDYDDVEDDLGL